MMKRLYIAATLGFWIAFAAIGAAVLWPGPEEMSAGPAPAAEFTLDEVARHAGAEDCWMAIHGQVYDLSAYLPQHPTPPAVILPWCGREASEAYDTKTVGRPHSAYASELLERYRIGRLAP